MSVDLHRQAEHFMAQGDLAASRGQHDAATHAYRQAAELEASALERVPNDRRRTRGIIAVSAVALFRKAGTLPEAIHHAYEYLADQSLPEFAQEQLQTLLFDSIREEKARAAGQDLGQQAFRIVLRGGRVNYGLVDLDTAILKLEQFKGLFLRVKEWVAERPFRPSGPPRRDIQLACTPLVGEPSAGSFRFEFRFESPRQLPLPDPTFVPFRLSPDNVASGFFRVVEAVANESDEVVERQIPDLQYRDLFLNLVRNLAPNGKDLDEIEIKQVGGPNPATAILTPVVRETVGQRFQRTLSSQLPRDVEEHVRVGILRGLELDKGWIKLRQEATTHTCFIRQRKVYDDVVGPYVNKRVRVPGHWEIIKKRREFVLHDIVLDDTEDPAPTA